MGRFRTKSFFINIRKQESLDDKIDLIINSWLEKNSHLIRKLPKITINYLENARTTTEGVLVILFYELKDEDKLLLEESK